MMAKEKAVGALERGLYLWKVAQAALGFAALVWGMWATALGPGLREPVRNFVGLSELQRTIEDEVIFRIEFIEANMPAPAVVDWDQSLSRQQGVCNTERCVYVMRGARTKYGEKCGRPLELTPFIRTASGQTIQVGYADEFSGVELGRMPVSFPVSLKILDFIPAGAHTWRTRTVYEHCPGRFEPKERWTPWLPISIGTPTAKAAE